MKKLVLLATVFALLAAGAQAQEPREKRWRAQIGLGLPSTQSGKNFVGQSTSSGAISYDLGRIGGGTWGLYSNSLMRSRENGNTTTSQGASGFGVQYRMHSQSNKALYYGVGIGGYSISTSSSSKDRDTTTIVTTEKMVFGGRLFVGQDFGKRYFAELGFTATGTTTMTGPSINASHASLGVGLRF